MKTTLELLDQAKTRLAPISERELSQRLGHSPTAITKGRQRGSLSPVIAGQLAEMLGANVEHWMAIAAVESEPRSRVTDHLRRVLHAIA